MTTRGIAAILGLLIVAGSGCSRGPSDAAVADSLRVVLRKLDDAPVVRGERLAHARTVSRFYKKHPKRAWREGAIDQVVGAIRDVAKDGLDPADYHGEAIASLLERRKEATTAGIEADLDLLLTDAVAGMTDDLRYGRVQPVRLDPRWNLDLRKGAPPLDSLVAVIAASRAPGDAIAAQRPEHFIYGGLMKALADLREIESRGGWPGVPAGPSIKPGANDRRIPAVRRRLVASGELQGSGASDSTAYDDAVVQAVKLFQQRHRLEDDGVLDKTTVAAMNVGVGQRIGQVRVNLERSRWVLNGLKDEFLLVNLPAFKCYLIRGGKNVWEARTQVGEEGRQTPTFRATMRHIVFNPSWTVPPTILEEDVLGGMRAGKNVIAEKRLTILDANGDEVDPSSIDWMDAEPENFPYTLRQPPGEGAALGRLKFEFPNPYSIYLHDTPSRELFDSESRTFSSGCIRVENPTELAALLLQGQNSWTPAKIQQTIDEGETKTIKLDHTLPVLIVYWTVSVGASGEVRYARDVYDLDPPLAAALNAASTATAARATRAPRRAVRG